MPDTNEPIRVKFSDELHELLKVLEDENIYIAFELLWLNEPNSKYHNGLGTVSYTHLTLPTIYSV